MYNLRTAVDVIDKSLQSFHRAASNHEVPGCITNSSMCLYGALFRHKISEQNLNLWWVLYFVTVWLHYILIFRYFPNGVLLK